MRRFNVITSAALLAAFLLPSCGVEDAVSPRSERNVPTVTVHFTTADPDTKTAFAAQDEDKSYPTYWTSSDRAVAMSLCFAQPVEATLVKDSDESRSADFTATFEDSGKPYTFYAMSPLSAVTAISPSRGAWTVTIPSVQTPKADGLSCDEAAMLLYGKTDELQSIPESAVSMHFSHVTSYIRLTLRNLADVFAANDIADASVRSVDVAFTVPVAGEWYVDAADGSLEEKDASHTITLMPAADDLTQPLEMWLALAPCTLSGETVTVTVNTDKGSISRGYAFGDRTCAAGVVNRLSLDMTKNATFDPHSITVAETVYALVSSASDISAGDEVIFTDASTPAAAMGQAASGTSGFAVSTAFTCASSDGYVRLPDDSDVTVWTVATKSGTSVTFKNGSSYLTTGSSGSSHYPKTGTSAKTFTLSVSSGTSTLSYKSGSGKTTYSLYCSGSYFTCFSSTSSATETLGIWRKATVTGTTSSDPGSDPIMQQEEYGAYLSDGSTVHVPGTSQLSRETLSDGTVTFAIIFPDDNEVLQFGGIPSGAAKGDEFPLVLTLISGRRKTVLGTFEVTVLSEDGATLKLSDFAGNGFIVKR